MTALLIVGLLLAYSSLVIGLWFLIPEDERDEPTAANDVELLSMVLALHEKAHDTRIAMIRAATEYAPREQR